MEGFKCFSNIIPLLVGLLISVTVIPVYGQINTPCTTSMITSVTPCLNFIAQSSGGNGSSSPTADCCGSLKSLLSTSMDCACLIITGSVPFQLPINRTLAISLPRACKLGGVPVQCNASGSPLPAPGPASFGPASSPAAAISPSSSTSPTASVPLSPSESDPTLDSPPVSSKSPTGAPSGKPVLNTPPNSAAAKLSQTSLPSGLFVVVNEVLSLSTYIGFIFLCKVF